MCRMSETELIKVYLSGLESNEGFFTEELNQIIDRLSREGICAYVPCYPFYMKGKTFTHDLNQIADSCAILLVHDKSSDEVKMECMRAEQFGIPIFKDIQSLVSYIDCCESNTQ